MSVVAPFTESAVKQLVEEWYAKLDVHAPMVDLLPMLADDGLEMRFPEGTLHSYAEFEIWYQGVVRLFFDEVHELKEVNIDMSGDRADIQLVVKWQASRWNPPAAKSERIVMDAEQSWIVKRSPMTSMPIIVTYSVDDITYYDGSAKL